MVTMLPQLLVNGMINGALYAVLGLSWGIIYSSTGTFHFAHALVITVAAYAAVLTTMVAGLPLTLGFLVAILAGILTAWAIELGIYRPLRTRGATQFGVFIGSLGTLIVGENVILLLFKANVRRLEGFPEVNLLFGSVGFSSVRAFSLVLCVIVVVAFWLFMQRTRSGRAIRALSSNPEMARTVGIDTARIVLLVYALGSALAAIAATLISLDNVAYPTMGVALTFSALIVTFIGGIGSLTGTVAAGLLLGLTESLALFVMPAGYQVIVSFLVLLIVIILRPRGLFGGSN